VIVHVEDASTGEPLSDIEVMLIIDEERVLAIAADPKDRYAIGLGAGEFHRKSASISMQLGGLEIFIGMVMIPPAVGYACTTLAPEVGEVLMDLLPKLTEPYPRAKKDFEAMMEEAEEMNILLINRLKKWEAFMLAKKKKGQLDKLRACTDWEEHRFPNPFWVIGFSMDFLRPAFPWVPDRIYVIVDAALEAYPPCAEIVRGERSEEIWERSDEKMASLKSFRASIETTIEAKGAWERLVTGGCLVSTIEAYIEVPDKVYAIARIIEPEEVQPCEVLKIGDSSYIKWPPYDEWKEYHAGGFLPEALMSSREALTRLKIADCARDVRREADEEIGGVEVYHFTFSIDGKKYLKVLIEPEQVSWEDMEGMEIEGRGEIWIGKEDLLRRRVRVNLILTYPGKEDMIRSESLMEIADFNRPVRIPSP